MICSAKRGAFGALVLIIISGFAALGEETDAFQNLIQPPDTVFAVTEDGAAELHLDGGGVWRGAGITLTTKEHEHSLLVELAAPAVAVKDLQLRWAATLPADWKYLGDAWERSYGDLQWKPLDGKRVMPWYFLASNGKWTHGYGVKTGPAAFCHWTADAGSIVLHADVRCGGSGVLLGGHRLTVCSVTCRRGTGEETPFAAAEAFCGQMCSEPRLPRQPVYGFNDWYCYYGHDTAGQFLKDSGYFVSLAPKKGAHPFAVVDDGWERPVAQSSCTNLWSEVNPKFSTNLDMPQFARRIKELGARPGLWYRPLIASPDCPASWRLARDPHYLDPTVPEVRAYLLETIRRFHGWGFEFIKHDFSTFDLLGKWGPTMTNEVTANGWAFADRSRTTAQVIHDFYLDLRHGAGNRTLILGCNTVGHLSAGIFEMQRIGDDTSGRDWKRVRKMGVNTLAFRAPQHDHFFAVDADCAGQTTATSLPWAKNSQWLDLLAHSGTVFFASFPQGILNPAQEQDLRAALSAAAQPQPLGEPLDWQHQRTPMQWKLDGGTVHFNW